MNYKILLSFFLFALFCITGRGQSVPLPTNAFSGTALFGSSTGSDPYTLTFSSFLDQLYGSTASNLEVGDILIDSQAKYYQIEGITPISATSATVVVSPMEGYSGSPGIGTGLLSDEEGLRLLLQSQNSIGLPPNLFALLLNNNNRLNLVGADTISLSDRIDFKSDPILVENVDSLKSFPSVDGGFYRTKGYYTAGVGGEATYIVISDTTGLGTLDPSPGVVKLDNGLFAILQPDQDNYNVESFGLIGDSITDNRPLLVGMIDFVDKLGGGNIYVPQGIFGFGTPTAVTVDDIQGVHFRGVSDSVSVIHNIKITFTNSVDISFKDLKITQYDTNEFARLFSFTKCENIRVDNCYFQIFPNVTPAWTQMAFVLRKINGFSATNSTFKRCQIKGGGADLGEYMINYVVDHCRFIETTDNSISIVNSNDEFQTSVFKSIYITNNEHEGQMGQTLYFIGADGPASAAPDTIMDVYIMNNVARGNSFNVTNVPSSINSIDVTFGTYASNINIIGNSINYQTNQPKVIGSITLTQKVDPEGRTNYAEALRVRDNIIKNADRRSLEMGLGLDGNIVRDIQVTGNTFASKRENILNIGDVETLIWRDNVVNNDAAYFQFLLNGTGSIYLDDNVFNTIDRGADSEDIEFILNNDADYDLYFSDNYHSAQQETAYRLIRNGPGTVNTFMDNRRNFTPGKYSGFNPDSVYTSPEWYQSGSAFADSLYNMRLANTNIVYDPTNGGLPGNVDNVWLAIDSLSLRPIAGGGGGPTSGSGTTVVGTDVDLGGTMTKPINITGSQPFTVETSGGNQLTLESNFADINITGTNSDIDITALGGSNRDIDIWADGHANLTAGANQLIRIITNTTRNGDGFGLVFVDEIADLISSPNSPPEERIPSGSIVSIGEKPGISYLIYDDLPDRINTSFIDSAIVIPTNGGNAYAIANPVNALLPYKVGERFWHKSDQEGIQQILDLSQRWGALAGAMLNSDSIYTHDQLLMDRQSKLIGTHTGLERMGGVDKYAGTTIYPTADWVDTTKAVIANNPISSGGYLEGVHIQGIRIRNFSGKQIFAGIHLTEISRSNFKDITIEGDTLWTGENQTFGEQFENGIVIDGAIVDEFENVGAYGAQNAAFLFREADINATTVTLVRCWANRSKHGLVVEKGSVNTDYFTAEQCDSTGIWHKGGVDLSNGVGRGRHANVHLENTPYSETEVGAGILYGRPGLYNTNIQNQGDLWLDNVRMSGKGNPAPKIHTAIKAHVGNIVKVNGGIFGDYLHSFEMSDSVGALVVMGVQENVAGRDAYWGRYGPNPIVNSQTMTLVGVGKGGSPELGAPATAKDSIRNVMPNLYLENIPEEVGSATALGLENGRVVEIPGSLNVNQLEGNDSGITNFSGTSNITFTERPYPANRVVIQNAGSTPYLFTYSNLSSSSFTLHVYEPNGTPATATSYSINYIILP